MLIRRLEPDRAQAPSVEYLQNGGKKVLFQSRLSCQMEYGEHVKAQSQLRASTIFYNG